MYLDDLPDAAVALKIKAAAHGRAITENGKAAAVAFTGDGKLVPESWLVRFDIAEGQDGRRLLADAFVATGAGTIWYFGGDAVTRRAVNDLGMESTPHTGLFVRRAEPVGGPGELNLRAASEMDARTRQLISRHVEHYDAPRFAAALAGGEIVGYAILQELTSTWSEVSAFVFPTGRRHGYGAEILARSADAAEHTGRMVCAAIPYADAASRSVLERAGFRLADYYFTAKPKAKNSGLP
jgi:GNAT superfamily N-acetyltransferase